MVCSLSSKAWRWHNLRHRKLELQILCGFPRTLSWPSWLLLGQGSSNMSLLQFQMNWLLDLKKLSISKTVCMYSKSCLLGVMLLVSCCKVVLGNCGVTICVVLNGKFSGPYSLKKVLDRGSSLSWNPTPPSLHLYPCSPLDVILKAWQFGLSAQTAAHSGGLRTILSSLGFVIIAETLLCTWALIIMGWTFWVESPSRVVDVVINNTHGLYMSTICWNYRFLQRPASSNNLFVTARLTRSIRIDTSWYDGRNCVGDLKVKTDRQGFGGQPKTVWVALGFSGPVTRMRFT